MSNNVNPAVEESVTPAFRTLFIGLGGTGGEVLCKLWERMDAEQRAHAHTIYIDTDQDDLLKLSSMGVPSVNIGSSDTVRDIIDFLGPDDGVHDWISADRKENMYLSSSTHDGASQYRTKSRLCLAKFLKNPDNELKRILDTVSVPGMDLKREPLRVMIVSSIAGGTGAGSFIQVALYLRDYFRRHGHKDISITGMFACPDLFIEGQAVTDSDQIECMYANAYAAVREINAMNLVVDGGAHETSEGYGRSIHMEIKTESEGLLFDSHDPLFAASSNYKPYNLIYLMDVANTSGGVLRTMDQYFSVMADVAYTRLYTALEGALRSGESNELDKHQDYPTAIYGSAGYGKIIYPYEGVVDYLALQKTHDEMDYTWSILENEWEKYQRSEQMKAKESGRRWIPTTYDRGNRYISDLMVAVGKSNSGLQELAPMIRDADSRVDRAAAFLTNLAAALTASGAVADKDAKKDGAYSLCNEEKVASARKKLRKLYDDLLKKTKSAKDGAAIIQELSAFALSAESAMKSYVHAIRTSATGSAYFVSSVVAPRNEKDGQVAMNEADPLNLFHGLLSMDGKAVHPVAARYLLYSLRKQMKAKIEGVDHDSLSAAMDKCCGALHLALDPNPNDDKPITVDDKLAEISKTFFLFRNSEADSAMKKYLQAFTKTMGDVSKLGDKLLMYEVYTRILGVVDVLIEQYEGLFDNLDQYRTDLTLKLARERDRHEMASDDRCIFINGSRQAKEHLYYADRRTRDVLDASSEEISAAAGEGVYHALMLRTWKYLEQAENVRLSNGYLEMEEDTFSDMGDVFEGIVAIYKKYLKSKATHLHVDVVTALIRECCRVVGVEESELATNFEKRVQVCSCFESVIHNMLSKAEPMLNFNNVNADPYFTQEAADLRVRSSILYTHIGLSPVARNALKTLYPGTEMDDVQAAFEAVFKPTRGATVNDSLSDYEIIGFKAVHCLQPTQIRKFREDYHHGFYFYYKKRLVEMAASGTLSKSPHLDKRWHLREAMPYISHDMDVAWHHKTARAFVYEILNQDLKFTLDDDGVTCFIYPQNGQDVATHVYFPEKRLVTVNDISRLLEFLQEDDELIELKNQQMDEMVEALLEKVSKHTDSLPVYKATLTSHPTLRDLRSNLLVRGQVVSSTARVRKGAVAAATASEKEAAEIKALCEKLGIEEADLVDRKKTLGGLLTVAWLVHRSEEKQGRDHDFGECIVKCACDIIEQLCREMCGVNVSPKSDLYAEYCDLYNSIVEKFMEAYVLRILSHANMRNVAEEDEDVVVFYRYLKVPESLTATAEYKWATKVMPLKDPKAK